MLVSRGRVSGRPSFPEAGAAVSLIRSLHTALRRARGRRRHAVVAAGLALLMVTLSTLTSIPVHAEEDRLLQGVTVQVASDGTITAVEGSTVTADAAGKLSTSGTATYSPTATADELPVRVRTSYTTADGAGTDLADLDGYTGLVTIDLTVENLTVQPERLTYDVAGNARTQTALVGAPLTVVASTSLPGTPAHQVVTASQDASATTNGVLSQSSDGIAQVQWATFLAPPQLAATANLRLVLDAKDLQVPDFNLSVQTGLVTDPSVQGLLDAAFSTGSGSQLALTTATIEVINEVNEVLASSGTIVSKVRSDLATNAGTLGTQTVTDLTDSSTNLTSSMAGIGSDLDSLSSSLSQSLNSTESTAVSQLLQVVNTVRSTMGDTTQPVTVPTLSGEGCASTLETPAATESAPTGATTDATGSRPTATVPATPATAAPTTASPETDALTADPAASANGPSTNGLYGSLAQVSGQLQAYAQATDACRLAVQEQILTAVGPQEPDAQTCAGQTSTSCQLLNVQDAVTQATQTLRQQGADAVAAMQPQVTTDVVSASDALALDVDSVATAASALSGTSTTLSTDLATLETAAGTLSSDLGTLTGQIDSVHTQVGLAIDHNTTASDQASTLADQMCTLLPSPGEPDAVGAATKVESLRAYLTSAPCDKDTWVTGPLPLPEGQNSTLSDELTTQAGALSTAESLSDTTEGTDTGTAISTLGTSVQDVVDAAAALRTALDESSEAHDLDQAIKDLTTAVDTLKTDAATLGTRVDALKSQQESVATAVSTAFTTAADGADAAVGTTVSNQIRLVTAQAQLDAAATGALLDQAATSMDAHASSITQDGAVAIDQQNQQVDASTNAAVTSLDQQVQSAVTDVTGSLTTSALDVEAARTLLTDDLAKVLLDIGSSEGSGTGLIGLMTSSAALAGTAGYHVALAEQTSSAFASVRSQDLAGILLERAQVAASLRAQENMPAFHLQSSLQARTTTLYSFHVGGQR